MNWKQKFGDTHLAAVVAVITALILAGCALRGPSEAVLQQEVRHIGRTFKNWTNQPVEKFLKAYPEPLETLDMGGGKVRYSIDYTPRSDNYDESRYYLLYFYISEKGIIYNTDYSKESRPGVDQGFVRFKPVGAYSRD